MTADSLVLQARDLHKSYIAGRSLFTIALLELHAGTAYALTGQNGAGKTTLMRILAGLEPASQGSLQYQAASVPCAQFPARYPREWRRSILYVHQQPYMLRGTVHSNVAYGLRQWQLAPAELEARVKAALSWAQLEGLAGRDAKSLSGGERQRVALARAHALQPRLWLLDEPTANLDGASREQVIALIDQLTRSGASVVIATHDRDLLERAALHRLKLQDGALLERQP